MQLDLLTFDSLDFMEASCGLQGSLPNANACRQPAHALPGCVCMCYGCGGAGVHPPCEAGCATRAALAVVRCGAAALPLPPLRSSLMPCRPRCLTPLPQMARELGLASPTPSFELLPVHLQQVQQAQQGTLGELRSPASVPQPFSPLPVQQQPVGTAPGQPQPAGLGQQAQRAQYNATSPPASY